MKIPVFHARKSRGFIVIICNFRRAVALRGSLLINLLLLMIVIISIVPASGQGAGSVAGRTLDGTGSVLHGVAVTLRRIPAGEPVKARSAIDGGFRFESLAPGRYRLTASTGGFNDGTVEVDVAEGAEAPVEVTLQPSAVSTVIEVSERLADVSGVVTKSSVPLIEEPQSISVVGKEEMMARAPLTLADTMRYTAGVRTEQYGFDARGDWASIRGGTPAVFQNGMRVYFGSYNNTRPEPFAVEQVEVMRGPSSVLFGQGGFGGVVNVISKRPLPVHQAEISVQGGMYGRKQFGLDVTGPINSERKLLYRFVGVGRDSNTQVHYVPDDRLVIAPSISWRPRSRTQLTLLTNFQEDRMGSSVGFFPWKGTLLPNEPMGPIHPATFISEPGFDAYDTSQRTVGYLFEHRAGDRFTVRHNFNYSHSSVKYQSIYADFRTPYVDGRKLNRVLYVNLPVANSPTTDTHVETRVRSGFIRHTILTGFDFQQATITGRNVSGTAPAIDVYAPLYGNYTVPALVPSPKNRQWQRGVYAQDQIKIGEHWAATLGIRKDRAFAETVGSPATNLDSGAVTGRAGLVYLAGNGIAPYFSLTESFLPVAGVDFYNSPYKPQRSRQYESGIRYEPGNGRIHISGALFHLTESNRRTPDPANPRNSIQVGEVESRGVEFESRFKVPAKVDVIANYAYDLARVSKSNGTDLGKRLSTMPLHLASVWATRRFHLTSNHSLVAGPGIRYTGSSFDGIDVLRTPSYTLVDLMAALETPRWRLGINGSNIGDKIHMTACLSRGDCFIGVRRNVVGSFSYRF